MSSVPDFWHQDVAVGTRSSLRDAAQMLTSPLSSDTGCALAAMRMALWVVLLLSDPGWLTNNDTSIDGM